MISYLLSILIDILPELTPIRVIMFVTLSLGNPSDMATMDTVYMPPSLRSVTLYSLVLPPAINCRLLVPQLLV